MDGWMVECEILGAFTDVYSVAKVYEAWGCTLDPAKTNSCLLQNLFYIMGFLDNFHFVTLSYNF